MGQLSEKLKPYPVIGLDTAIFIYHFEENPAYLPLTRELLSSIESGERKGVTSTITLMEIIVKPLALGQIDVARKYEALLANFPNLEIIDLDRDVIRLAARLRRDSRAEYRIRPPDALQAAACLQHGAQAFITNDDRLKRLQDKIAVLVLEDYAASL